VNVVDSVYTPGKNLARDVGALRALPLWNATRVFPVCGAASGLAPDGPATRRFRRAAIRRHTCPAIRPSRRTMPSRRILRATFTAFAAALAGCAPFN
jgi:hypothetical protein